MVLLNLVLWLGVICNAAGIPTFSLRKVQCKDWAAQGEIRKVVGQKLYDLIDGLADIHMGFSYMDSEHLKLGKGKWQLEVSAFRVDTPDNAFGLYSCLRQRDGELVDLANEASYAYGTALLWRGPYCVEVKDVSEESAPREEIVAVCKALSDAIEGRNPLPELVRALPKEKLVNRGLIYFHNRHPFDQIYYVGTENVLLLGADVNKPTRVEAVYADYGLPKGPQGVLVIRYPKTEEAKKALELYTASVRDSLVATDNQPPWRILTGKNGKQTTAFQKDRLLILALESSQSDAIRPIMEKIAKNLLPEPEEEKKSR